MGRAARMSTDWEMGCEGGGIIGVGSDVAEEDVLGFEEGGGAVVAMAEGRNGCRLCTLDRPKDPGWLRRRDRRGCRAIELWCWRQRSNE